MREADVETAKILIDCLTNTRAAIKSIDYFGAETFGFSVPLPGCNNGRWITTTCRQRSRLHCVAISAAGSSRRPGSCGPTLRSWASHMKDRTG